MSADNKVRGISRVADNSYALLITLDRFPGDDELRSLHDYLHGWPAARTPVEVEALSGLLALGRAAWSLLDNTANSDPPEVEQADWDKLSAAMMRLDELPDDRPGFTMEGPSKAIWALRRLIGEAEVGR